MKKPLWAVMAVAVLATAPVQANPLVATEAFPSVATDVLTGDVRLACEATLCLASGERPDECTPSLKRYFSIKHKRWRKTHKARQDFLKLCPIHKGQNAQ